MTWGFAFPAYIRFPDKETPDFFPIFQVLNAWSGVPLGFELAFSAMAAWAAHLCSNTWQTLKNVAGMLWPLEPFFGDGTGSGLSSRSVSNESLPSGPDSLDDDVEAGGNDEDYDSADSLDDDSMDSSDNAGDKKKDEKESSSDEEDSDDE